MFHAVIFDMDGVLIDSEMIYLEIKARYLKKFKPDIRVEQLFGIVGHIGSDSWLQIEQLIQNGQSWQELRAGYLAATKDDYASIDYKGAFRPQVPQLLDKLKAKGYQLAVASSNSPGLIQRVLDENGIAHHFSTVISGEQFKRSKPSPEIYHCTAAALGVPEQNCFVVEDSTAGITAAHRAGMTVAALTDRRFAFDQSLAHFHVAQIQDILELL